MDANAKKQLGAVSKMIKEGKFKESLNELEVMLYKYSKEYRVHLMSALCYQKMNEFDKAENEYLEVLDLQPNQPNALKELCEIYTKKGDINKSIKYLEATAQILKDADPKKHKEVLLKLLQVYDKDDNLEKIDPIFQQYVAEEDIIREDFVAVATAYYRVGVRNQCFNLQRFEVMGYKDGKSRVVEPAAREALNSLLIDIANFLVALSAGAEKSLTRKEVADSLVEMKLCFPQMPCMLMLILFDEYCVGQLPYSPLILEQIFKLLSAFFDKTDNYYSNIEYTQPQMFAVCMLLSSEYLIFFKQFFSLDVRLDAYLPKLYAHNQVMHTPIRDDYRRKINAFIMTECRQVESMTGQVGVEDRLEELKRRILRLEKSYLEQVVARIALGCISNYEKINDLKNLLKLRIKNLAEGALAPHLYKYYYDYLIKMATLFKALDEQIPMQEVLNYIHQHDPHDKKYHLELLWFNLSVALKEDPQKAAKEALEQFEAMRPDLDSSLKSSTLRRIVVCRVVLGQTELNQIVEQLLNQSRCVQNLQLAGSYYAWKGDKRKALQILKEAFVLNQVHYHSNRLLFLLLLERPEEAMDFLIRIREGFTNVFWVNYFLAIDRMNSKKVVEGEKFMSEAVQCFQSGLGRDTQFSYEKVRDFGAFSVPYLVKQNEYALLIDAIVWPEESIYKECPMASNIYFKRDTQRSKALLYLKQAELLKVLGRTSSALNYLQDADEALASLSVTQESEVDVIFECCLVKKEYAALLFYNSCIKESQITIVQAYVLSSWIFDKGHKDQMTLALENEIKALSFEISVERLRVMVRFESPQTIDEYLSLFRQRIDEPTRPTLNFYKNKYQFHILEFMHKRAGIEDIEESVRKFLSYYQLDLNERQDSKFGKRLLELSDEGRRGVRECMQDYYIVRHLAGKSVSEDELIDVIRYMPRSPTLYILLGMTTSNVKTRTAAFLRCIQLDKESVVSIDILACLYLKQQNYLAAAKLFLKSLELDVLNSKCYLGLAVCLCCVVSRALHQHKQDDIKVVEKCLSRVQSYLEFLRVKEPSQNYHLLSMITLLVGQKETTTDQARIVLQGALSNCRSHREGLFGELIRSSLQDSIQHNPWVRKEQAVIVDEYLKRTQLKSGNISSQISTKVNKDMTELDRFGKLMTSEILTKRIQIAVHELSIAVNLGIREKVFNKELLQEFIQTASKIDNLASRYHLTLKNLMPFLSLKESLTDYAFSGKYDSQAIRQITKIFPQIRSYSHFAKYGDKIPNLQRELNLALLNDPSNPQLRTLHSGCLLAEGKHLERARLPYHLQILNRHNEEPDANGSIFKKMYLMNRSPEAMVKYIQMSWSDTSTRDKEHLERYLKLLGYILKQSEGRYVLRDKVMRLRVEMIAYWKVNIRQEVKVELSDQENEKVNKLVCVLDIIKKLDQKDKSIKESIKQIQVLYKGQADDWDWWILIVLMNYLTRTLKSTKFDLLFSKLQISAPSQSLKGALILMRFCIQLWQNTETQDELVQQLVNLNQLSVEYPTCISPNSEVIFNCCKHMVESSYEDVEAELNRAAQELSLVSYSDRILVNMFEVIKLYKLAEANPNSEGVLESFEYMNSCMLEMVKEPLYKGFLLGLKGMLRSLVTMGDGKDRDIKMGMLLAPPAARAMLGQ